DFALAHAVALYVLVRKRESALSAMVPLSGMLPGFTSVVLTPRGLQRALHGGDLGPADMRQSLDASSDRNWVKLLSEEGAWICGARHVAASGALHPSIVLL